MGNFLCEIGKALLELETKFEESSNFMFETTVVSMQQIYVTQSAEKGGIASEPLMLWKLILRSSIDASRPIKEIFARTVLLATGK